MGATRKPACDPDLAKRVAWFRATVEAEGGPTQAIDVGRPGLADLWRWFGETHKPLARPLEEAEFRGIGPMPGWSLRRFAPARGLGPDLTWLVDGLAAHLTSIVVEAEPTATWVIANDVYLGSKVPMLQLEGRPRLPIDDLTFELVGALHSNRSYQDLDSLDAFVEFVLAYGDPRPRPYEAQTAKEARALLEFVASGSAASVEQFLRAVEAAGGPIAKLDFSPESLIPLWTWLTSRPLPPAPIRDLQMRRHELPWWYAFTGRLAGQALGPELCWLATGAADYLAAIIFHELPGSSWGLGLERIGADFREPLLRIQRGGELNIHDRMARLIVMAHEGDDRARGPNVLRSMFDHWLTRARRPPDPEPATEPLYVVRHVAPPTSLDRLRLRIGRRLGLTSSWSSTIMFSDAAAHLEDRRVDRFVRLLAKQEGIERAFREDREIVLVAAPDLSAADLGATVDRVWLDVAPLPPRGRRPATKTDDPGSAVP